MADQDKMSATINDNSSGQYKGGNRTETDTDENLCSNTNDSTKDTFDNHMLMIRILGTTMMLTFLCMCTALSHNTRLCCHNIMLH